MADPPRLRIVPRGPREQIERRNVHLSWRQDLYHQALSIRWAPFLAVACAGYLFVNLVFAVFYLLDPNGIAGARPGSLLDAFFFSIQTIATIGYGQMSPATLYCNLLVTLETMTGLVILALLTGITFARISRPTARVVFAKTAVIGPQNGMPTLTLRIGNERRSQILEADVALTLLRFETTTEGVRFRRFYDLPLLRSHTPVFSLTFNVMHPINAASPLHGATVESLAAEDAQLLLTVTGLEEVTSQTVHARYSYDAEEIRIDRRYVDIFTVDAAGRPTIDYADFHETVPLDVVDPPG